MKRVVIKIGSSTLVDSGKVDAAFIGSLAADCAALIKDDEVQPIIVSSGSIALGLDILGFGGGERPNDMPTLQAAASVGQVGLIRQYRDTFALFGVNVGQVLITRATTGERESYLHARDTIERLLELGVVPIINENDTVAVEEIRFGDNDTLAAMVATSINAELKDARRNLPIALVIGTLIVALTYILYYIGLSGSVSNAEIMAGGETGAKLAFEKIFGRAAGVGLFVLVVVSCLGTLNGLMLAATRSLYSVAARGNGPKPEAFLGIDQYTNMPANSAIVGVLMCAVWLTYFYGANLTEGWFGPFCFDSSELPIITLYALYIPMFLNVMRREKELNAFHRYVMPVLSIVCCIFFCVAAVVSHGKAVLYYLIVFAVIMALAIPFYRQGKEKT